MDPSYITGLGEVTKRVTPLIKEYGSLDKEVHFSIPQLTQDETTFNPSSSPNYLQIHFPFHRFSCDICEIQYFHSHFESFAWPNDVLMISFVSDFLCDYAFAPFSSELYLLCPRQCSEKHLSTSLQCCPISEYFLLDLDLPEVSFTEVLLNGYLDSSIWGSSLCLLVSNLLHELLRPSSRCLLKPFTSSWCFFWTLDLMPSLDHLFLVILHSFAAGLLLPVLSPSLLDAADIGTVITVAAAGTSPVVRTLLSLTCSLEQALVSPSRLRDRFNDPRDPLSVIFTRVLLKCQ